MVIQTLYNSLYNIDTASLVMSRADMCLYYVCPMLTVSALLFGTQ